MNDVIIKYFIARKGKHYSEKRDIFIDNVADKISFCNKLEAVRKIYDIPKPIYNKIQKIKDLRNDLAHNYFPEGKNKTKAIYCNSNVFSEAGISLFLEDTIEIQQFFIKLTPFG